MKNDLTFQRSLLSTVKEVFAIARTRKREYKYDADKIARYYQVDMVKAVIEGLDIRNIVIVESATGTGKTLALKLSLLVLLNANKKTRALVIANNEDLLRGFQEEFNPEDMEFFPIDRSKYPDTSRIHTCTTQWLVSLKARDCSAYKKLLKQYGYLGIDEVQHYPCQDTEWGNLIEDFKDAGVKIIGMTATAFRTDKDYILTKYHDDYVVYRYSIEQGVRDGYLCEVYGLVVFTGIKPIKEVWNQQDLDLLFTETDYESRFTIMGKYLLQVSFCMGRKPQTLIFVRRKTEARALKKHFDKCTGSDSVGVVEVVTGEIDSKTRGGIYDRFKKGEVNVIINVQVVTEGVNLPNCEVVINARPTRSVGLYKQMMGRGTRIPPTGCPKEFLLVIDFVDNISENHMGEIVTCGKLVDGNSRFVNGPIFTQEVDPKGTIVADSSVVLSLYAKNKTIARVVELLKERVEKNGWKDPENIKKIDNSETVLWLNKRLKNEGLATLDSLVV